MKVFVTGATGFIGTAVVQELIGAGHKWWGWLAQMRAHKLLSASGAQVHRGNLDDLESLRSGAANADSVIHCAFDHSAFSGDFSKFTEICEQDRRAIETLGEALLGSNRPLIVTSGTAIANRVSGELATEDSVDRNEQNPRQGSEVAVDTLVARGVNASVMRLPQVHDTVKQGLITYLVQLARQKGRSAYVGDGSHRWPAAPVRDVAQLYRLRGGKAEGRKQVPCGGRRGSTDASDRRGDW